MPEAESAVSSGANVWVAVADGDMERVKYLLEHEGVTSTSKDESGYTPLHAAASYNQHELLQYLLEQADDAQEAINVTDNDGDTPLFFCDVLETAKLVVEKHGADATLQRCAAHLFDKHGVAADEADPLRSDASGQPATDAGERRPRSKALQESLRAYQNVHTWSTG